MGPRSFKNTHTESHRWRELYHTHVLMSASFVPKQAAQVRVRRGIMVDSHLDDVRGAADRVRVDARRGDGGGACPFAADGA